jgi:hypothetical protein
VEEAWAEPKADTCTEQTDKAAESQCHKRRLSRLDGDKQCRQWTKQDVCDDQHGEEGTPNESIIYKAGDSAQQGA